MASHAHQSTESADSDALIGAHDLACVRGGRMLFAHVSFTLKFGQSLLLRGPNGVGKSSLLRLVAGLLPLHTGHIDVQVAMALCDEQPALDEHRTLAEALSFWARLDGSPQQHVTDALAQFALMSLRDIPVRMLSTGQRKRASLARVQASGARLWLLDEPGNGVDTESMAQLGTAMQAHVAGGGCIIAASHFDLPFSFTETLVLNAPAAVDEGMA